jgi:hypothetical protein
MYFQTVQYCTLIFNNIAAASGWVVCFFSGKTISSR